MAAILDFIIFEKLIENTYQLIYHTWYFIVIKIVLYFKWVKKMAAILDSKIFEKLIENTYQLIYHTWYFSAIIDFYILSK